MTDENHITKDYTLAYEGMGLYLAALSNYHPALNLDERSYLSFIAENASIDIYKRWMKYSYPFANYHVVADGHCLNSVAASVSQFRGSKKSSELLLNSS